MMKRRTGGQAGRRASGQEHSAPSPPPRLPAWPLSAAVLLLVFAACKDNNSGHAQQLIAQYGCNSCHVIPGAPGHASIGPSLEGVGARAAISNDKVPNTPENLAKFIREPASLNPTSSMPALNMPADDAETIAAYLSTLK